jgi:uncharacterized protein YgbK (DUF1537 family)
MSALGNDFTIAGPAFPENGRTVFKGYLFVGDELLHESGMRNHPLTPMTDSSLVRVLQAHSRRKVGLIDPPHSGGGQWRHRSARFVAARRGHRHGNPSRSIAASTPPAAAPGHRRIA